MGKRTKDKEIPPAKDWPSYWFVRLDEARRDGDNETVSESRRELRRLGYEVSYVGPPKQGAER